MEQNADIALQKAPVEHNADRVERFELIPVLLFLLIVEVSYVGVFDGLGQNLGWFFALVLLNAGFLMVYVKQTGEFRKNKEIGFINKKELESAQERIAQSDETLRKVCTDLAKTRAELGTTKGRSPKATWLLKIAASNWRSRRAS